METGRALIVGREVELAAVDRFLQAAEDGAASFLLEGVAGIGKTSIWSEALHAARERGVQVRACKCGESDAGWAFSGLADLLDGLPSDVLGTLPPIQQQALSAAMLTSEAPAGFAGDRVIGVAFLGVLRALSAHAPVLLAIDDVQWLDPSSSRVVSFALRRLRSEPVRLLASKRISSVVPGSEKSVLGLTGTRLHVGPVNLSTAARIVSQRLEMTLSRATLTRLHRAIGGNPMVCLEMARALQRRGREPEADEALPVPADLRLLVTERLQGLSPGARRMLLITAALAQPNIASVAAATGESAGVTGSLAEALAAGVLELDGARLRFTHPLLASIPYADLSPTERQTLHSRLAACVTDPEERARHAALGSEGPDPLVADALEAGARRASLRGSAEAACELAELAAARTPPKHQKELLRRRCEVAGQRFKMGETSVARRLVREALEDAEPGPARVPGLLLLATIMSREDGDEQVAELCDQALVESRNDVLLQARCHATLAETCPSGPVIDLQHAQAAVRLLESLDSAPADLLSNALTNVALHGLRLGNGLAVETLERAEALQTVEDRPGIIERAAMGLGMGLKHIDRFEECRGWLLGLRTAAVEEGDESALPMILGQLALLECWAGRYPRALACAEEGRAIAERTAITLPALASAHVLTLAHVGRLNEARALGQRDLEADEAAGFYGALPLHLRSLGFVDLFGGDPAGAAAKFLRALTIATEIGTIEPAMMRLHPDAVAALVSLGRVAKAEQLTDELDASRRSLGLPWATVMAGRCRGLLHAASGDFTAAIRVLEQALVDHQSLPMPFELARTQLLLGAVLRRAGQRGAARLALSAALESFVRLGTPLQAEEARRALESIGGRSASPLELTTVEARVAALAGAGQTNREVADALFISVRTVESHLGRVYRKLGLRSRTELSRRLPVQSTSPDA